MSGVERPLGPEESLWYRRRFEVPAEWHGQRVFLNFEAVDWSAEVWVNGKLAGEHQGGYDPFGFDFSPYLSAGENELVVKVTDPTDQDEQPRGKQVLNPEHIWYRATSGIWQTVWLEPVPEVAVAAISTVASRDGLVDLGIIVNADAEQYDTENWQIEVAVQLRDEPVLREVHPFVSEPEDPWLGRVRVNVPNPALWSPESPHLYDLKVTLKHGDEVLDEVTSYFGIREVAVEPDSKGIARLTLNGETYRMYGLLDQGYWPDGGLTPPSEEAMRFDLEWTKRAGFNTVRKHVKVEPRIWYRMCDELGLLVWQDMPSGGPTPKWEADPTKENPSPDDDRRSPESKSQFLGELERLLADKSDHPCLVVWVVFNEAWGQHDTVEITEYVQDLAPEQVINAASGGNFTLGGGLVDLHKYPGPAAPPFEPDRAAVLGEFGGYGLPIAGHLWSDEKNWGYRNESDQMQFEKTYEQAMVELSSLMDQGLSAAIYTQTTDVESEVNGLLSYDREVEKISAERLAEVHRELLS